ncbi:MAG TPA: hypothetical protein PLD47_18415 [Aggregatilineales bacterium]|nr:hypothetical protein [Anaerolineales bacterium]HRE49703.1 hypothetical protein [Aggregatilineales bacterium]
MTHSQAGLNRVIVALTRAKLTGVTEHTLAVASARLAEDALFLDEMTEAQLGAALLTRVRYPLDPSEMSHFLSSAPALTPNLLAAEQITDEHAQHYVRWLPGFLSDPATVTSQNARVLMGWLASHRAEAIRAKPDGLAMLRRVADDPTTSPKSSAYIAFMLGACGTMDDYDRVIQHAERVIEHDRERIDLVAEGLYRLYPPALINALNFFLEGLRPDLKSKQAMTGLYLLEKVVEFEDSDFWKQFYDEMDAILGRLRDLKTENTWLERLGDQLEKQLAYAGFEEDA